MRVVLGVAVFLNRCKQKDTSRREVNYINRQPHLPRLYHIYTQLVVYNTASLYHHCQKGMLICFSPPQPLCPVHRYHLPMDVHMHGRHPKGVLNSLLSDRCMGGQRVFLQCEYDFTRTKEVAGILRLANPILSIMFLLPSYLPSH